MNQNPMTDELRILVLTGTDVHAFSRVCDWADVHAESHPTHDVLVQHGYTPAPRVARAIEIMSPAELDDALREVDVVVSHGGPGTISTARAAGFLPVILARDPHFGEHVDGHQIRFARWAGERGLGIVVSEVDALDAAIQTAAHAGGQNRDPQTQIEASIDALAGQISALDATGTGRAAFPLLREVRRRYRLAEGGR